MTMLTRAAALLLIAAASAGAGSAHAQTTAPATTQWICFYTSDLYPEMGPIGFLEENGRRCPLVRNDPTYGQMFFVSRQPWD